MPVTAENSAPYAPTTAIVDILRRHRDKGLPSPVDADVLARAGISQSLISRTLQALQTLDLIDEEGKPTEVLEGLRLASESEYKEKMAEWLKGAYADALTFVDPATDDETRIHDAFRGYKPTGQRARMVTLFIGLFSEAGLIPERSKSAPRKRTNIPRAATMASKNTSNVRQPKPTSNHPPLAAGSLPPSISGILASLPEVGRGWTKERRDMFVQTFGAILDFCYPIVQKSQEIDGHKEAIE